MEGKEKTMISGLAKKQFKRWYENQPPHTPTHVPFDRLMAMSPSIQWGIYQDWADSIGYPIETYIWYCSDDGNNYYGAEVRYQDVSDYNKTRQEARNAAIEKLNEIINKQ